MTTSVLLALLLAATPATPPAPPAPAAPARPAPPAQRATGRSGPAPAASPVTDSKRAGEWPARPSGKTVTLDEQLSLDDACQRIADAAGWNLVASTGRLGQREIVVRLHEVPVEEALDAVLEGAPLVATRRGNTVTVAPGRAPALPEQPVLSGFEQPTGKRFTGDFADEPVAQAIRKVADAAGLSVVFPPGVRGIVNGHFKDAPVEDALRAVLAQAGLIAQREGAVLTVSREGGRSVVIQGGKRVLTVPLDVPDADLGREIERSVRDSVRDSIRGSRDAREAAKEAKKAAREARRQAREEARAEGGKRGDRVLRGDQVIAAGERAGDVVVLLGSVRLEAGASAHQVVAVLGSVELGPGVTVDGEVVAVGGDIHVSPGARAGGDAVSVGGRIVIDEGGEIDGQQTSVDVPGMSKLLAIAGIGSWGLGHHARSPWLALGRALLQFVVFFGLGLLLLVIVPRRVDAVSGSLSQSPWKALLAGILGAAAVPIVSILLVATLIGIPLVAVLVLAVLVAGLLGYAALALLLGRSLPFRFERGAPMIQLAIGTAVLVAVGQIPVLGWLTWAAAWMVVFGAVLRTRFGRPPSAPAYATTAVPPPMPPPGPPPVPPAPPPAGSTPGTDGPRVG